MLFKTMLDRQVRLQRIYTPLRIANADLCGSDVSPVTGIVGSDRQSIPNELRSMAQRLYGVSDGVTLIDVAPNSPAAQAGLQPRDVITGAAKGAGVMPSGWTTSGLTVQDLVKVILTSNGGPITLLVRRSGSVFPVEVKPALGCRYPIESIFDDRFNAFADGNRIVVFTGLFNHVPDDREIAVIVGHELAHNILRHIEKTQGNVAAGGAAGLLLDIGLLALGVNTQGAIARAGMEAGSKAYSQDFESEADYLGLYMLARAGFNIHVAPELYRRLGVQNPGRQTINYFSTHPSTTQRAAAMTQTIAEIQEKLNRREALLPKTLQGQTLAVAPVNQGSPPIIAAATQTPALSSSPPAATVSSQPALTLVPVAPAAHSTSAQTTVAPVSAGIGRLSAQLYLIRGPIVSNPPQTYSAEFLESGRASVVLGRGRLEGDFELFGINESVNAKYTPRLIKPQSLKPTTGADARGFAVFTDGVGTELECYYFLTRQTGRGQGMCVDNRSNTYRIVFD